MNATVLIVDDSLTVRMDLLHAFEAGGFGTVGAATAAEARQALTDGGVDAIVLDVLLPDADGVDLLTELRASATYEVVPIILLSTESEVKDRIRGLRTGADEYVGKPGTSSPRPASSSGKGPPPSPTPPPCCSSTTASPTGPTSSTA
jgi:two-component system, NtrC family, sensor kinase